MKKFYFLLSGNIIIDAIDYSLPGYTEVELNQLSLPPGINGRYYRLIDGAYVFDAALKESQIDEITQKVLIGLGNIDNTSDLAKPISTAQQTALNLKANLSAPTFSGTVSGITKAMVGLNNVDNTSDMNKPVSTAQQLAITAVINSKASVAGYTTTITTASWTESTAPFISVQTIEGILNTDIPIIDIVMSGTYLTDDQISGAWGSVYRAVTTTSQITFYASEKPIVNIPIQLRVVR